MCVYVSVACVRVCLYLYTELLESSYRKCFRRNPVSSFFFSCVIVDCDKLAPSYLKPPIEQMVCPGRREGN